jgi:hypothetical protein
MNKDAEQLQASLQRAAGGERIEGEMASLVRTAQLASSLAAPPPPPPNKLALGRQRFLTEAAHVRASRTESRRRVTWMPGTLRLAGAFLAVVLVLGAILGVGQAAADSLPGEPLYALKLTAETIRVNWTTNPEARADLSSDLVAERLAEITRLIEQGQPVAQPTVSRAKEQLALALQDTQQAEAQAALQSSQKLETTLRMGEQAMRRALDAQAQIEQRAVQELLRGIERIRRELYSGQGEPQGDQPCLPAAPDPTTQPGPGPRSEATPARTEPTPDTGAGAGPWPGERPTRPPHPQGTGMDEAHTPGPGAQQPAGPRQGEKPGSEADPQQPPDPQPTGGPGSGSGPQQPAGPQPTGDPGSGSGQQQPPGPQPTDDPGPGSGTQPNDDPGSGSGHPPVEDPGSDADPQQPGGTQQPDPTGTDPGGRKP